MNGIPQEAFSEQSVKIKWVLVALVFCIFAFAGTLSFFFEKDTCSTLSFFQRNRGLDEKASAAFILIIISTYFLYFGLSRDIFKAQIIGNHMRFKMWLNTEYSLGGVALQYLTAKGRVLFVYPISLFTLIYLSLGLFTCWRN